METTAKIGYIKIKDSNLTLDNVNITIFKNVQQNYLGELKQQVIDVVHAVLFKI